MDTKDATEIKNFVKESISQAEAATDLIHTDEMEETIDVTLPIEDPPNTNKEDTEIEKTDANTEDAADIEISKNDLLDHQNDGDGEVTVSKQVINESFDDSDEKLNAQIIESVEMNLNLESTVSVNKDMVLKLSENIDIREEDLALPIEVTVDKINELKSYNLEDIDNLSDVIENEIIAFKKMKQSTSSSTLETTLIDERQSDKTTEESLSVHAIISTTELPETSKSDINTDHNILSKDNLDKEEIDESSMSKKVTDDSIRGNCNHGLNKLDMMLEIHTQELTDIGDVDESINSDDCNQEDSDTEIIDIRQNNTSNDIEMSTEQNNSIINEECKVEDKADKNADITGDLTANISVENIENHELLDSKLCTTSPEHITSKQAEKCASDVDIPVEINEVNCDLQEDSIESDKLNIHLHDALDTGNQNKCLHNETNTEIQDQEQGAKNILSMSERSPKINENIEDPNTPSVEEAQASNSKDDVKMTESSPVILNTKQSSDIDNSEKKHLQLQEGEPQSMELEEQSNSECDQINSNTLTSNPTADICKMDTKVTLLTEEDSCNKETEAVDTEIPVSTTKEVVKLTPDTSDEVPEMSDSLGLLAESSRVAMEDDEYQEDEDEEDDDFDPDDESSNQMTAEHSEDSNAHHSESDVCKEQENKSDMPEDSDEGSIQFNISTVPEDSLGKKAQHGEEPNQLSTEKTDICKSVIEDIQNDKDMTSLQDEQEITKSKETEAAKVLDTSDEKMIDVITNEAKDLAEDDNTEESDQDSRQKSNKRKKLEISHMKHVVNIVDLGESSSEDDIQEIQRDDVEKAEDSKKAGDKTTDNTADAVTLDTDDCTAIDAVNDSEVTIEENRDAQVVDKDEDIEISDEPDNCPEKRTLEPNSGKPKIGLEIFNLDSDEEDNENTAMKLSTSPRKLTALEVEAARGSNRCVNYACASGGAEGVRYVRADAACLAQYASRGNRHALVCTRCAQLVTDRTRALVDGIKNMTPLLELDMEKLSQDLVEISDSDSEDETEDQNGPKETIGEEGAKYLEACLGVIINDTWIKYKMDSRLEEAHILLNEEVNKLQKQKKEVDQLLADCQAETDTLRNDLYATFDPQREELPPIIIYDTPVLDYVCFEEEFISSESHVGEEQGQPIKRRYSSNNGTPAAKRPAIPLGYTPLDLDIQSSKQTAQEAIPLPPVTELDNKMNEDKDVAVVQLSVESAPAGLPPPGEPQRPPLKVGMQVYAMRNSFGSWLKGRILECHPKSSVSQFTVCRVKFDHKIKNPCKMLPARCIAYNEPSEVRMTIGTRVISLFKNPANANNKKESYYSGIVAEVPNPVNNYRYLVFFDDGYAQYASHVHTRLVCESSVPVWDEVHPFSREFVRDYLIAYPERPMVRLHAGQRLKTEWNGKWWSSKVMSVDASLVKVHFEEDNRTEWIYRGSTRLAPLYLELQAAVRHRPRPLPRSKAQTRSNMPYVEYTRSEEQATSKDTERQTQQQQQEEIRRQRAVAKKSTSLVPPTPVQSQVQTTVDAVTSRVVYYTPKNAVRPYRMVPHTCSSKCKRTDVLDLKELRTYNPLAKPLLSGWERQIVRYKGLKEVMYRAPCGRRVRNMPELHRYLRTVRSDMPVDLFDFQPATHCLAEFVLNKCIVGKKDLSHGKENVPVPCVNYYDDALPEFCSYNTERTPTAGVPLNLDPAFLCGCDCTDDCQDKTKCSCWKMTLEGARTIGMTDPNIGYVYKRLPEPLPSGIYECNSRCKCKHTCLNRVAQHPLQLKLQVFKTLNRGWGIRALNDVPKGSFLCVYAGNLLTDATANLDGLNEGDEYLAELDYIEVVEQMKEGYEEDIPDADKKLDQKESSHENTNEEESSSSEEENVGEDDAEDVDFTPGHIGLDDLKFSKRLRERGKGKKNTNESISEKETQKESNTEDDCITISDDEEVREPSRFAAQAGMGANEFISKYRSVRTYFGKDEACYIMDAKVQGNIGRYLNHSCSPNVFVQNVFVDTHDPRFPWVAFFALSHIRAGTELTWNYNYDVGSVPEKVLYCFCGAPNCRGRLL